jgi:hypothetical protein
VLRILYPPSTAAPLAPRENYSDWLAPLFF